MLQSKENPEGECLIEAVRDRETWRVTAPNPYNAACILAGRVGVALEDG